MDLLIAAGGSFLAALLGAAVGLVLGSIRLPAILLASGNAAAAAGTNIAVSAVTALVGGITHARAGRVDWRIVAWMAPPSVVAAFVGGLFGSSVPEGFLLGLISVVLFYSGLDILLSLRPPVRRGDPRAVAAISGAIVGLIGGAVGLILGTLRMPALLKGVGMTPQRAVGTNLVVGFFLGVSGFLGHLVRLEVEWDVLAVSVAAAIPGAWLGARLTGRMSETTLKRAIGVALLVISVVIAASALS